MTCKHCSCSCIQMVMLNRLYAISSLLNLRQFLVRAVRIGQARGPSATAASPSGSCKTTCQQVVKYSGFGLGQKCCIVDKRRSKDAPSIQIYLFRSLWVTLHFLLSIIYLSTEPKNLGKEGNFNLRDFSYFIFRWACLIHNGNLFKQ